MRVKIIINKTDRQKIDVNLFLTITNSDGQVGRALVKRELLGKNARKNEFYSI